MKLNELKQLIRQSAGYQVIYRNPTVSFEEYIDAGQNRDKAIATLIKLNREGKLNIDVNILRSNINQYFGDQDAKAIVAKYTQTIGKKPSQNPNLLIVVSAVVNGSKGYVNILDLVPSCYDCDKYNCDFARDNRGIENVFYKSLEQTRTQKLNTNCNR